MSIIFYQFWTKQMLPQSITTHLTIGLLNNSNTVLAIFEQIPCMLYLSKYSACYIWANTYKNIEILEKQGSKKQCRYWNTIETYNKEVYQNYNNNNFFFKGQKKRLTHKFSFFLFWWVVGGKGRTWNIMKKPRSIGENIKLVFVEEVS